MHKNFMNIKIRNTGTVIVKKKSWNNKGQKTTLGNVTMVLTGNFMTKVAAIKKKKKRVERTKDHAGLCYNGPNKQLHDKGGSH